MKFAFNRVNKIQESTVNLPRQIISFLPSATEMACALGLSDQLCKCVSIAQPLKGILPLVL